MSELRVAALASASRVAAGRRVELGVAGCRTPVPHIGRRGLPHPKFILVLYASMERGGVAAERHHRSRGERSLLQTVARLPPWGRDLLHMIRGLRQFSSAGGRRAIVQVLRDLIRIVESEHGDVDAEAVEGITTLA